jgi:hypothetical protein
MSNWSEAQLAAHLERTGVPGAKNTADVSRPPFHLPVDISIDLPVPLSVNQLRRINWANHKKAQDWRRAANACLMLAKASKTVRFDRIPRFELTVTLDDGLALLDLDNSLKLLIDYLVSVNIVANDSPKHMRRLVVQWGSVSAGCNVVVRPCQ